LVVPFWGVPDLVAAVPSPPTCTRIITVIDLTCPNERGSDVDDDISDDEQGHSDMPTKGWTGLLENNQAQLTDFFRHHKDKR